MEQRGNDGTDAVSLGSIRGNSVLPDSVPLFNNIFPFFCPLIIDPAGRAVPAWLQPGLDTLRNEFDHTLVIDGHDTSALGELFEATPMVPTTYSWLVVSSCA